MADSNSLSVYDTAITPQIIMAEGAGKAYQSVAQSTALAIQDATDNLRNINTISATVMGVAMAQLLETKDTTYITIMEQATKMSADAAANFQTIGVNAANVLKAYPAGQ